MAITNSVAIGTGKKKLGEVVLSTVKGRTIARKYQPNVANPNTQAQINQRNKMANCVMLWGIMKSFMRGAFVNRKRYQSAYNAFVSANVDKMDVIREPNAWNIIENRVPFEITNGQLGEITLTAPSMSNMAIVFSAIAHDLKVGDILRMAKWSEANKVAEIYEEPLTSAVIGSGQLVVSYFNGFPGMGIAYIVSADRKKSTNAVAIPMV